MAELKTRPTDAKVSEFLDSVADDRRRADAIQVAALMEQITRRPPRLWGSSIIGFGSYRYQYASGRSGEWPLTGLSPRKQALTLYIMSGFDGYEDLLADLGRFRTGKSCLYVNRLEQIDERILARLIRKSVAHLRRKWPTE
ncbi:MAG: DUF1801 domain-containing protein [Pseudomonadota bacterium]